MLGMMPAPRVRGRWLPTVLLLAATCACGSHAGSTTSQSPARPTTDATLQIVQPQPNARTPRSVEVELELEHAHVVPAAQVGGEIRPDEGHIHLSVDGQLVAMPTALRDRLAALPLGTHTLEAEFVGADHLPFANRVVAAVTFTVG
jgi:hypothetical protein